MYNRKDIVYIHILDETVPFGGVASLKLTNIFTTILHIFGLEVSGTPVSNGFSLNLKYKTSAYD